MKTKKICPMPILLFVLKHLANIQWESSATGEEETDFPAYQPQQWQSKPTTTLTVKFCLKNKKEQV